MPPWLVLGQLALSSYSAMPCASFRHPDHFDAVFNRGAEYVSDNDHAGYLAQPGQLLFHKSMHPDVLQPDGIHHSGGRLDDARACVPRHWLARQALGNERANPVQRYDLLELEAIAKGPAGRNHRRAQHHPGYRHVHVGLAQLVTAVRIPPSVMANAAQAHPRHSLGRMDGMLDLAYVRANLPVVEEKLRARGMDPAASAGRFLTPIDRHRRAAITSADRS
jgi:hypothetical protein